jgi:hypothetical protein
VPIVWKAYGGLRGRIFPAAACALIAFDLITLGYGYTGFSRRNEIFPRSPLFDFLTKQTASKQFRTATLGIPFPLNTNIVYGFDSADGYEVRMLPAQLAFCLDYVDNTFPGLSFVTSRVLSLADRRLDLLNVQYFVTAVRSPEFADFMASGRYPLAYNDGNVALFENKSVLPRAFAVPSTGIRVFSGTDTQLASLKDSQFDPLQTVLLSSLPASLQGAGASTPLPGVVFSSSVEIAHNGINRVSLRTMTSSPSVLVVSQTYYPGWRAFVDGNSAEIFAADLALTGIALPAGVHEVELTFRPSSVTIGAVITVAAAVILLVLMIAHAKSSGPKSIETKQILKMTSDEPSSGIFQ